MRRGGCGVLRGGRLFSERFCSSPVRFAGGVAEQVIAGGLGRSPALGGYLMTLKSFGFVSSIALVSALASPAYAQDQTKAQGDAAAATTTNATPTDAAAQPAPAEGRNQEIVVTAEFRQA